MGQRLCLLLYQQPQKAQEAVEGSNCSEWQRKTAQFRQTFALFLFLLWQLGFEDKLQQMQAPLMQPDSLQEFKQENTMFLELDFALLSIQKEIRIKGKAGYGKAERKGQASMRLGLRKQCSQNRKRNKIYYMVEMTSQQTRHSAKNQISQLPQLSSAFARPKEPEQHANHSNPSLSLSLLSSSQFSIHSASLSAPDYYLFPLLINKYLIVIFKIINMEKLIPIISELQEIVRKSDVNWEINLPILAVVGSQSTGKSSLLQSIIGKEFLPKGKGIVTRRPIEIQLSQVSNDKEYVEFVDKKGEFYENMEEFRKIIETETEKACGANKGISSVPLRVRFYSKKVLNLLLVDLPGIVKNPTGDQPKDIEEQVTKMIKNYIKNPNCIIIAVSKATDDSANSESLKLAREVDREGARTIGVLTQVDLVDENVNILRDYNTLSNKLVLGHTCVYLRPAKSALTIEQQQEKEIEYFRKHDQYCHIADKLGVKALVKTMNMVLVKHIKLELPTIRENIIYLLQSKKDKLAEYGTYEPIKDKKAQGILLLALISKYVKFFVEMIEGKYGESREAVIGGARIEFIFSQIFIKSINRMNPFEFLTDTDIRTAIRNANGLRKSLFLPELAFQTLLKTQILRLKLPSLQCAHLIHEQLRRMIYTIKIQQIERYQNLSKRIFEVMQTLLLKSLNKTEEMIKNLIQIELGYINTNHPDFIDVISLVKNDNKSKKEEFNNLSFESESQKEHEDQPEPKQSLFKFNKKHEGKSPADESEVLDAKLNYIQSSKLKKEKVEVQNFKNNSKLDLQSFYSSFSEYNQLPRYMLPSVPSVIKVNDNPKLREQTQTDMIKRLIVSYFNVVKKNVNDSIPKAIVTFLVNHCRNSCEKILVNNLYVEMQFQELLLEQDYVVKERERLNSDITVLKECLSHINSLESQLSM